MTEEGTNRVTAGGRLAMTADPVFREDGEDKERLGAESTAGLGDVAAVGDDTVEGVAVTGDDGTLVFGTVRTCPEMV